MGIWPLVAGPCYYFYIHKYGVTDVADDDIIDIYGHLVPGDNTGCFWDWQTVLGTPKFVPKFWWISEK